MVRRNAGSSKRLLNERAPTDRGPNNRDSNTARSCQADVASFPSQFDLPPAKEEMRNRRGTTPKTGRNIAPSGLVCQENTAAISWGEVSWALNERTACFRFKSEAATVAAQF
jgi:hypothetical protein